MVSETIIENQDKPVPKDALAEFPGLAARLAELDAGFDAAASEYTDDEEITPGLMEGSTGAGSGSASGWRTRSTATRKPRPRKRWKRNTRRRKTSRRTCSRCPGPSLWMTTCPRRSTWPPPGIRGEERLRKEQAEKKKLKLVSDEEVIERTGDERLEEEEDGVDDRLLEDPSSWTTTMTTRATTRTTATTTSRRRSPRDHGEDVRQHEGAREALTCIVIMTTQPGPASPRGGAGPFFAAEEVGRHVSRSGWTAPRRLHLIWVLALRAATRTGSGRASEMALGSVPSQ